MPAVALSERLAVPLSRVVEKPYAVLLLPSVLDTSKKQDLFLPLTLAYLLSAHIPFQFPLRESALAVVERAFDDILNGLPKDSKGICYRSVDQMEPAAALVPRSSLLLTDEHGLRELPDCSGLPLAVISKAEGNTHVLTMRNLHKIEDLGLRGKLAGCAQLINIQAGGFVSEGHFSLSW
jgi:hypothetical protein